MYLASCSNISLIYSIRIDQQVAEILPQKKVPINGVKKSKVPQLVLDLYVLIFFGKVMPVKRYYFSRVSMSEPGEVEY